jgi:hypothetical protein
MTNNMEQDYGKNCKNQQQKPVTSPELKSWLQYSTGRNQRKDRKNVRRSKAAGIK